MDDYGLVLFQEQTVPMLICEQKNLRILIGNKAFQNLSGYTNHSLESCYLSDLIEEKAHKRLLQIQKRKFSKASLKDFFWKSKTGTLSRICASLSLVTFKKKKAYLISIDSKEPFHELEKVVRDFPDFTKEKYQYALDTIVNGVVIVNQNGKFIYINESVCKILNTNREYIISQNIYKPEYTVLNEQGTIIPPGDTPLAIALREKRRIENKTVFVKIGSIERCISIHASPLLNAQGEAIGAVSTFNDITEERKARELIQKSEDDLKAVLNASTDGAFFLDLNCNILMFNTVAEEYIKRIFSRQVVIGECVLNYSPPGRSDYFKANFERVIAGEFVSAEEEFIYPGVYRAFLDTRYLPVYDRSGKIIGISLSLSDITKRKEAEHRIVEKEIQLRNVAKMASIGEWELDVATLMPKWSAEVCRIHDVPEGYSPSLDEAIGFYTRDSSPVIKEAVERCIDTGEVFDLTVQIISKSNKVKWLRVMGLPEMRRNVCIKLVGLVQDITKQKEAEYELSKMALIAKHTNNIVIVSNATQEIEWVNEAFAEVTGYSLEEVQRHDPFVFLLKGGENREIAHEVLTNLKKKVPFKFEAINYSKVGKKNWLEVEVQPVFNTLGNLVNYIVFGLNITDRKKSEEALAEQYKLLSDITSRLSLATKASNLGVWQYHVEAQISVWDDQVYKVLQTSKMNPLNKYSFWKSRIHPEDVGRVMHTIKKAVIYQTAFHVEMKWYSESGLRYLDTHGLVTLDENNNKIVTGVISDVTQNKLDEISLKQTEERYRELFNASPLPTIFFERSSFQILDVNDAACAHYGYSRDRFIKLTMQDIRPPSEHLKFKEEMNNFRNSSHFLGINLKHDGSPIYVEAYRHTIHYGSTEAIVTTVIDVTEQMKLKEEENKLNHIITETANEIFIVDKKSLKLLFINERALKNLQYSYEELKEMTVLDIKKMGYEDFINAISPLLDGWTNRLVLEVPHYRKDQTRYENKLILQNLDENRIIVIGEDISERKNYIHSLETLIKQKDTLVKEIHHRIKNNLQLISSIIYLKSSTMDKSEIKQFLADTRSKIRSVALIHEQLLQSEEIDQVDIAQYINKLVDGIRKSQFREDVEIRITTDIESHCLKLDTSIYFGLIVNELVINAIKHAFDGRVSGEIEISFKRKIDNNFTLSIYNDGNPLPFHINPGGEDSFGMQLLDVFVKQLRGQIDINREVGTKFTVEVKL